MANAGRAGAGSFLPSGAPRRIVAPGRKGAAMTPFEFVFSLFALLLGLSLAEVLGGLARTLKQRRQVRLGLLTPLLGLLVMLDLTSSWALAYSLRDSIPANFLTLVIGLFVTGLYFLAA